MSPRPTLLDDRLMAYVEAEGVREHRQLAALRAATDRLAEAGMRSATVQVALLGLLIEVTDAKRVLEIGCFTGYGTLGMALALPPDGRVTTLDVNADWAAIGRQHWEAAGVAGRIELLVGLALDSLDQLLTDEGPGSFDLAYVDADKKLYDAYYERALALVRAGGLVVLDNVLWRGAVADPDDTERQTVTLRELNRKIHDDPRVSPVLLPLGDGMTLARKR